MLPTVHRTWSPKGQTPVLRHRTRSHKKVSVIGALSISPIRRRVRLFLAWYVNANVRQDEVIQFLRGLLRHPSSNVIVIWDRLNAHRSHQTSSFVESQKRLTIEFLPPYAPELNPIEGVWGYLKYHRLPNHGIYDVDELHHRASDEADDVAATPELLRSFVAASGLPIRIPSSVH
jgi:hypothetical protein